MTTSTVDVSKDQPAAILLGGRMVQGQGTPLTVVNPATGKTLGLCGTASPEQVNQAVLKGKAALADGGWGGWEPHRRAAVLHGIHDAIIADLDRIAGLQMIENGKTMAESQAQARSAAGVFRYYAGVCETLQEEMPPARGAYFTMTVHEPLGVVAALVPWNSPLTMGAQKLAPALAAGNAVVLKPAESTSLVSLALGEACMAGGLPEGLVSVLPGRADVGGAMVAHPDVGCVSFTGGTSTGQRIAATAMERLVPTILELGGKSPHIVFEDADLEAAAKAVAGGIFGGTGQSCVAGSRLFVQAAVQERFRDLLVAEAARYVVGPPTDPASVIGPLASFDQRARIERYVVKGLEEGGHIVAGGARPQGEAYAEGAYYLPTILGGLDNRSTVAQEEIFGPVLVMMPFDSEEDLIARANDSVFGLASGIWTADYKRAWRVARALEAGTVWINTYKQLSIAAPFGGFKLSGLGREKGIQGLRAYQQAKSIYWGL